MHVITHFSRISSLKKWRFYEKYNASIQRSRNSHNSIFLLNRENSFRDIRNVYTMYIIHMYIQELLTL